MKSSVVRRSTFNHRMTELGHFPALPQRTIVGCFTSGSSHNQDKAALTLCANSGREQVQQAHGANATTQLPRRRA
jgi:hypothetical protein